MNGLKFTRTDTLVGPLNRTTSLYWDILPLECGVRIEVTSEIINVKTKGTIAFDNRQEQADYEVLIDMAILAMKYMRQSSRVPPDTSLRALVKASKVYEEDSP